MVDVYLSMAFDLLINGTRCVFPRHEHCVGEDVCLDYAGKDVDSGANLFYLVQGECSLSS
jgi:hypothetical protein